MLNYCERSQFGDRASAGITIYCYSQCMVDLITPPVKGRLDCSGSFGHCSDYALMGGAPGFTSAFHVRVAVR
jgi:hypothetical protein